MADNPSLVQQLYHRKMFRITAGYLAVAWVLWQVVDTTCPTFECSLSFQKSIFWFLIAGLPITLAIAWVNWRTAILVGSGLLAGAAIMFFVMRGPAIEPETATVTPAVEVAQPAPATVEEKSIAVLPFADMSAAGDQGYFGDGVAEEILNALVKLPELRVAARTSAFSLRGQSIDVVGEKLKVNHVLEGSIRKAGDRLRITAQLIKVADGFHLWSESYDRELSDVFVVQDEIAKAVVDALKIELGVDAGQLVTFGTTNREAYDWYLRGKDAVTAGTAAGYQQAVEYLGRAIAIDPQYADAHAYFAYAHIRQHPFRPYEELAPTIERAHRQALEVDPQHSGALCAKGYETIYSHWDWAEAGTLIRTALANSKFDEICAYIYAWYLIPLGRGSEAMTRLQKAEQSDPMNLEIKNILASLIESFD